jgi:hypothetical protein
LFHAARQLSGEAVAELFQVHEFEIAIASFYQSLGRHLAQSGAVADVFI